jgi:hypothetical protein
LAPWCGMMSMKLPSMFVVAMTQNMRADNIDKAEIQKGSRKHT